MIVLISYLIFILTSLAIGLARENTDAINSWGVEKITLSSTANVDMRQSFLTKKQAGTLTKNEAYLGETPVVAEAKGHKQQSAFFVDLKPINLSPKISNLTLVTGSNIPMKLWQMTPFKLKAINWGISSNYGRQNQVYYRWIY